MNIKHEKAKESREKAMPEVKKLVTKYGRSIIYGCIMKLADYDKKMKKLQDAKKEVEILQKELKK